MKLGIIAAGESSRMFAEGVTEPKPLVKINGVPVIERIIIAALNNGITDICCIVNERFGGLRDFLLARDFGPEIQLTLISRSTPSSMHSLFALASLLHDGPFLLATADTVFLEDEFRRFVGFTETEISADGILAITRFIDDEHPLCVDVDEQMRIIRLSDTKQGFEWATGGLYYFSPRIFDVMEDALRSGNKRLRNFLRLLIGLDFQLYGYPFSKMIDVDHATDIAVAEQFLADASRHHNKSEYDQ